jgi:hypothetical protein
MWHIMLLMWHSLGEPLSFSFLIHTLKNKKPSVEPNQITFFVVKIFIIFQNTVLNAHPASATFKTVLAYPGEGSGSMM